MKTAMQLMEELGLHEGGVENWIPGNAWETFADLIRADAMEAATRAANESWTLACKKMVEFEREALETKDWTAIMREGGLVTWGDAEELGERVRAVIEARGGTYERTRQRTL